MRHGFLLIDKPRGPTSHDVVRAVRTTLSERSVGHLGTLDPLATGLLVLGVGRKALKVLELFTGLAKEYDVEVTLGARSSTYDAEGMIEEIPAKPGFEAPAHEAIEQLIRTRFVGTISQVPPAWSAKRVGGERAYRKMRQGRDVLLAARPVEISACQILSYKYPRLRLRVVCGSGTYIRSLAHDLGGLLRCGGYVSELRRTRVGEWRVEDARLPDALTWGNILPLRDIMKDLSGIELTETEFEDLRTGQNIERRVSKENTIGWLGDLPVCLLVPAGEGFAHARKVF